MVGLEGLIDGRCKKNVLMNLVWMPRSLFVWLLTASGAKKDVSLGSPLEVVIRLPMADIRSFPAEHNAPMVSNAIGTK